MWASDFAVYAVSRFWRREIARVRWVRRFVPPEKVQRVSILFAKYGGLATGGAPGLKPATSESMDGSVVAGRTSFRQLPVPIRFCTTTI
jgi:hypothetical protein